MSGKTVSEHDANKQRNKMSLHLLRTAVEVRQGQYREEAGGNDAATDIRFVSFSMLREGPLMKAVLINGELFVTGMDAGAMDYRDRQRMLIVARSVANNA